MDDRTNSIMLTQEEIQDALDDCNTFLETALRINKIKNEKMKITEGTKIKDILPEGYELVSAQKNDWLKLEEQSVNMQLIIKRKQKDFNDYVESYNPKLTEYVVGVTTYRISTIPMEWPWEFRIGLFKYICKDLDVNFESCLHTLKAQTNRGSLDYVGLKLSNICPKEFLKSLV